MEFALESYTRLPPITRTVVTLTFIVSAGIMVGVVPANYLIFHQYFLLKFPPQIWRLVTAFLITRPGLGLLFDTYFLYSYLSQMEVGNPRFPRKEDLIWYLLFVCGTILIVNYFTAFGFMNFLPALVLAMVYNVTQEQRGVKVNYMLVTIPAQLMPYAMLGFNLLFPKGAMNLLLELHGLFAGHLFDFLTKTWPNYGGGRNLIPTPRVLSRIVRFVESFLETRFGSVPRSTGQRLGGGGGRGGSANNSGGPLPDAWRTRGPGQRLG
ncbi:uncharacterized protein UV8b_03718 [Ustilaginoidea virens]|uniref:Derlin n=1 Tax=Ustilaginoidea virens TaxID=1159556 RepID=A0A8E5MHD4_USTVR|nr:uncharacterized protein UV8b_03718 [Ustilaginoidea virens]QUC19477.1 hypothetical protein UV8b_03718 [Ustilaginoidea virens]